MSLQNRVGPVAMVLVGIIALAFPFIAGPYPQTIMRTVFLFMSLALAWDILVRSGQLSFGIAGFFGLGAYASVIATSSAGIGGIWSILLAGLVAGGIAFILGLLILRLRAMYFAITTLALSEIFRIVIRNWRGFTGGPDGKILPSVIFDGNAYGSYYLTLGMVVLVIVVSEAVERGRFRFALTSIRNNEIVAKTRGVNIVQTLSITFAVSSALMGMTGAVYAQLFGFVTPDNSFSTDFTLLPLAMALLGGMYGTWGPIIGALMLGVVSEYLKLIVPYGHLVVYGIIIVLVILFMPQGIWGLIRGLMRKVEKRSEA